jgi:hypothetical protein
MDIAKPDKKRSGVKPWQFEFRGNREKGHKNMRLPGFSAERSLNPRQGRYAGAFTLKPRYGTSVAVNWHPPPTMIPSPAHEIIFPIFR